MKKIGGLIFIIVLASGCLEYTITTRIMSDGTVERIIMIEGDSASIFKGSIPVPADSSWDITSGFKSQNEADSPEKKTYFYKARKVYRNYKALNEEINADSLETNKIRRHVNIEKRFHWFYTFYRYAETYEQIFPFNSRPLADYLSDEEVDIVHANNDDIFYSTEHDKLVIIKDTSDRPAMSTENTMRLDELKKKIEKKYNCWLKLNIYDAFFEALKTALIKSGKHQPDEIERSKEKLYEFYDNNIESNDLFSGNLSASFLIQLSSIFYSIDSTMLREVNRSGYDDFDLKLRVISAGFTDSFTNNTIMPGIIISTNSVMINGNTATWKLEAGKFFEKDFTIWVESRMVNKGIMILSGALVLLLLAGLLVGIFRKRYLNI